MASGDAQAPTKARSHLVRDVLAELRVHQWVKNLLVFVSPLASHTLFSSDVLERLVLLFLAFCASASGVYVVNDLVDLESDRAHPRKRHRPLASGRLPKLFGAVGPLLMLVGVGLGFYVSFTSGLIIAGYILLSAAYSAYLKTQPLVDVFTLSGLYTIRMFAGENAVGIDASIWLLSFSAFMFLSLAFLKRVSEYQAMQTEKTSYDSRRGYTPEDVEMLKMMGVCSSFIATMVLSLYLNSDAAADQYSSPILLWGAIPVFLFWQSRMWLSAERGFMTDDPIIYAARDWVSRLVVVVLALLYLGASFL